MSTFNFDFVDRYDDDLAEAGRAFEVYAKNGKYVGTFTCSFFSYEVPKVKLAQERVRTRYAKELRTKGNDNVELNQRIAREVFAEAVITDWSGITQNGKAVEFSKEAALAYFSLPKADFVFGELISHTTDEMSFQAESKDDISGN